jgi:hypothetical protein
MRRDGRIGVDGIAEACTVGFAAGEALLRAAVEGRAGPPPSGEDPGSAFGGPAEC